MLRAETTPLSASPDAASILLVDDHPANLLALEAVLAPLGQPIVRAGSGEEALLHLREHEFAVVLLDVMMPGLDGLGTAELVRVQKYGRDVPIIFMTAGDTPALEGYLRGAVDVLRKPLDRQVVRAKVSVFVELFRARQEVRRQATRLEAQERRAEARTAALLNASLDAVIGMDHAGQITEFNAAAEAMFGRRRQDTLGASLSELLIPARQREAHLRGLAAYLATGESRILDTRIEVVALRADGAEFPIELAVRRVATDGPQTFLAYARDLTRRKQAEEASAFLAEASEAFASSLEYEVTLETVVRLAVPRVADWCAVDMLGGDSRKIVQLALAHVDPAKVALAEELRRRYPPDPDAPRGVAQVLRSGRSELYEEVPDEMIERAARDGEHLRLLRALGLRSAMVVPITTRGRTLGAITFIAAESSRRYGSADLMIAEDLARRAGTAIENADLYREAQNANRLKDEFLATVSHELRTPLTAILGWLHVLRSSRAEQVSRAVDTIERNAQAQARIVEDLLDVSRIVTGKLRLQLEAVDLADVVLAAIDTVRPMAEAKGIELVASLEPTAGRTAGDSARLQQVVWNLLSNAIKFTPKGGRVQVLLEAQPANVRLRVSDTGHGIRPDFLPYVFERFRQADSAPTRAYGGLGLGLAIVRHLVEVHGGQVTAESEGEGRGATFTVLLPLRALAAAPPEAANPASRTSGERH